MKKNKILLVGMFLLLISSIHITSMAMEKTEISQENRDFNELISIILEIKEQSPEKTEQEIEILIEQKMTISKNRGVGDIWNALTDSEKKLLIRYPFDALKVNKAKDIATAQTEKKFGQNGLGDRSDAFRHGIWNAEMVILIGNVKAELFATAHEDKDTTGIEIDGHTKIEHKNMDLHNNLEGRIIGDNHKTVTEDQLSEIIYNAIYNENTTFIWLNE